MLSTILSQKRDHILERWLHLIIDTYPADSATFLKNERDRFANPVGCSITAECEALFDGLCRSASPEELSDSIDNVTKIRAVQDFTPSQAIGFVFLLKRAIRDSLAKDIASGGQIVRELLDFEARIDELAGSAFDIYMQRREQIHGLRLKEIKTQREMAIKLLERASLLPGPTEASE